MKYAIHDKHGGHSFASLEARCSHLSSKLSSLLTEPPHLRVPGYGPRVALLCPRDISYVVSMLAVWRSKGVFVPMEPLYPPDDLRYFIENSKSSIVLVAPQYEGLVKSLNLPVPHYILQEEDYLHDHTNNTSSSENVDLFPFKKNESKDIPAFIIYTSGTTGRPKGVVVSHGNVATRVTDMQKAWSWQSDDVILHCLPLHHVHGVENCLLTPLATGATCVLLEKFQPQLVWDHITKDHDSTPVNLFMAVPTVYAKLLDYYDQHFGENPAKVEYIREYCKQKIRLMVSGSASLPEPLLHRWKEVTGHTLLERYGMTELGMALTNPLRDERVPGTVGQPFPSVSVRIGRSDSSSGDYQVLAEGTQMGTTGIHKDEEDSMIGELLVNGPGVFKEYFCNSEATQDSFTSDGWFKTGDTASYNEDSKVYRILGRTSVDIVKVAGYKVSALEVERHLLEHPSVKEVAVFGVPDATYGQRLVALLVLQDGEAELTTSKLREWAKGILPPHQTPSIVKCIEELPRNAMGKLNKKLLMNMYTTL